jgi:hypothetical protein
MVIIYLLSFLAKLLFLALTGYTIYKQLLPEREFYNDVLDAVAAKKFHALPEITGWTQTEFNTPRSLIELAFVLLVLFPATINWSWETIMVAFYIVGVFVIYRVNSSRSLNRNQVLYLSILRLAAIIAIFLA